jgi:hypothetical protein
MGVNFAALVYAPNFDVYAIPIVVYPAGGASYTARGILGTRAVDVLALDGSIFSDQQTILDLLEPEFTVLPQQGDIISIPADCNGVPQGDWEVKDSGSNGGGETTLIIRRVQPDKP